MLLYSSDAPVGWNQLPLDQKERFYNIASKGDWTAQEAYDHLVPDDLKDNDPEDIETFMDGGEVTVDGETYVLPDRDVSRIESGHNGGEYSVDNTVMEESSVNRARGADDMTADEFQTATESNSEAVDLLDAADGGAETLEVTASTASESVLEGVFDAVLPITYGCKAAHAVWEANEDMSEEERVAVTALAGGATVGATYTALALIPGLNLVLGGIALWKLGEAGLKLAEQASASSTKSKEVQQAIQDAFFKDCDRAEKARRYNSMSAMERIQAEYEYKKANGLLIDQQA